MRFVWISALKDLRRLRRDPVSLAMWIGIPLIIATLLIVIFGRGESMPQGRLLVADQDDSILSSLLTGGFGRGPLAKMVLIEKVTEEQGRRRMDRGDGSALLIIPKGFGSAFLNRRPMRLMLLTNPSQRILPGIIEEALSITLEAGFYLQLLAGESLDTFHRGNPTDQTVAQTSIAFRRLGERVARYLNPPLMQLETKVAEEKAARTVNFGALFFPGMLFMAILFIAEGLSGDIWKERNRGTLRRLAATAGRLPALLAGKLVCAAAVLCVMAVLALLAARWLVNLPIASYSLAIVWIVVSGASMFLMMLLIQMHASSERTAGVLGNVVVFPLIMAGGSFFPFESMPGWLAAIGRWTPNGWALLYLKSILAGTAQPLPLAIGFAGLGLFSAAAFLLAWRRLRTVFVTGE